MLNLRNLCFALALYGALATLGPSAQAAAAPGKVQFNRDIRPIFSDTCFHCHGFDAKTREAGLRLDIREEALKKTESDALPIVPGHPEKSEIITRIFAEDEDELMPPVKSHKPLTKEQKELIKRWVAEGAEYEAHWSYAPLNRPEVPKAENATHPVDAFVQAKLAEKKLQPSLEAPKAKLLRRLSLDLTGLPPTPEETSAFLADPSPQAYEKQVDRLLASPRFGERMAVWWLDIGRFTDTVGFHGDQNQRIFPYRDYVINAFNANKPFDQFTIEQLAGDLLPNATPEQRVATGYNRLNMMTREGGAQPKEYLAKYGAERVRSVAAAWFGSTFGCAECHDHKFDPIKSADFYSLQAFFADVKQWGVYADYGYTQNPELGGFTNDHPFPPEIEIESPYLLKRKAAKEAELSGQLARLHERINGDPAGGEEFQRWQDSARAFLKDRPDGWTTAHPESAAVFNSGKQAADRRVLIHGDSTVQWDKELAKGEEVRLTLRPGAGTFAALRLEAFLTNIAEKDLPAWLGKTVRVSVSVKPAEGDLRKLEPYFGEATAKQERYNGGEEILGLSDGWKLPKTRPDGPLAAVWHFDPVQLSATDELVVTLSGENRLAVRVSTSPFAARQPLALDARALRKALEAPQAERKAADLDLLAEHWLLSTAADRGAFGRVKQLASEIRELRQGKAHSLITEAWTPLQVRILPRGNWQDESGPIVLPATPSFLPGQISSTPEKRLSRLDLAKWIVSKENPITARAVMNRLWQQFYGTGLSAVLDDLGSQGEMPSHPELLDWLASEFRDSGWNTKHMIRLLVTSATYRQSSSLRPELRDLDPANRLLASQNPRRLDAEFVRDNALFIAGHLNLEDIGGPSVKPYQPADYYAALQFPDRKYEPSQSQEQWRRGVYMHWQRTFLHPMLANFDAPARDECAAMRVQSNTPQQALTLLNDPTFVEAARLLAARVLRETPGADADRIKRISQLALAREPKAKELASFEKFLAEQRTQFKETPGDAQKLIQVGFAPKPEGDPVELAAWTSLCRVVLNSQEVITRY